MLFGRAGRQLHQGEDDALVFVRQEGAWQDGEQQAGADQDEDVDHHVAEALAQDLANRALIAVAGLVEGLVEPAGETLFGVRMRAVDGLQQGGAERGRQHQGDNDRQGHGRDQGDGELAIDDALRAAEEGHGDEHGRQDQRDADQGAGDLAHRLAGRGARAQALFGHDAFDVFDDDDGVVDEQADGQHEAEQCQGVDRIAEGGQHAEGAEQDDRHGDRRDQGGAPVLQEDEHDDED